MDAVRHWANICVVLVLATGWGLAYDERVDDDQEFIGWRTRTWHESYYSRDRHVDNRPFDAARWREGDVDARGSMAYSLICESGARGMKRGNLLALLGPQPILDGPAASALHSGAFVYRVRRSRPFHQYEPPPPTGYRRIPDTYDIRITFDAEDDTVLFFDVLPAMAAAR